jgi:hypothetical protein
MALLLRFRRDHLATLIIAARRADAVRQDRLAALVTVLDLHGLDAQVAAAFALPGVGGAALRDCHVLAFVISVRSA